ncbi:LOW QUALITY PROTEIN: histidine kinase CKI1-like [Carya illinoinensis]|uniref:LOW QUALITY PROTEIN: histidine kinase CKI1-like n=1 Tax=Carya illinoinensis TaxID=32201 RepID=UPI001C7223BC|nr:LOW QUALITY PROTEIN: histidine kinase CKI1-like [Carya illinoinensis]
MQAFVMLLLPIPLIPCWYEIENKAKFLLPMNSSATSLARILGSSINGTALSFSEIETKVAPVLFQELSTIPYLSQISYFRLDGLFFSYYTDGNQTLVMYSNSSFFSAPNGRENYIWHMQDVDIETGKLYGKAIESLPWTIANASWFQEALNSKHGSSSLETGWNNAQDLLFLNSARLNGGVISLGFPVKTLTTIFTDADYHGGNLYLATQDGKMLVEGLPKTHTLLAANVSCTMKDGMSRASTLTLQETEYTFYCLPLDIVGVKSVYVLAVPQNGLVSLVHKNKKVALLLLMVVIATMIGSFLSFVFIIVRAARREMHLCAALIKQMEATQQAERKSMNKSLAFASASHDVRASLAGLTGLIEICYVEVIPGSELATNSRQMDTCAKDLLDLLNSILDTSKIEAGKMLLEEEEFDLARLLEDAVDLYHPVGMRKGVDVVLDPYDGSILKFSQVKGDRGKLKQILCNLLSNAVKFTSEGHVTVRAWVRKTSLQNTMIASKRTACRACYKNSQAYNDFEAMDAALKDPNVMDFVFEVDDTGKGIPKEKQKSVFENYVQLNETAIGQGGTGLGLGIVQSLVRLMHGDIGIVDKEIGEKGTCFRFNVLLTICEIVSCNNVEAEQLEMGLTTHSPSPKQKASHVVLLIRDNERRRMLHRFMENLGIKVSVVKQWQHLPSTLEMITHKQNHSHHNSSVKSYFYSPNEYLSRSATSNSITVEKDVPLRPMDGSDYILSVFRRTTPRCASSFILVVIDACAGPFQELCRSVTEFRRGLNSTYCRVVWLEKPMMRIINCKGIAETMMEPNDTIISKPFHGSRLYEVVRLLPEFGGTLLGNMGKMKRESTMVAAVRFLGKKIFSPIENLTHSKPKSRSPLNHGHPPQEQESKELFLSGKKVLVADDHALLRKLTVSHLLRLGATVELSENGQEALELVCKGLSDQRKCGTSKILPYDYILMDCEVNGL